MKEMVLSDKKQIRYITVVNRIARAVWDQYIVFDSWVMPADFSIKESDLFECSFFIIDPSIMEFLNHQIIIPHLVTRQLNEKAYKGVWDNGWVLKGKNYDEKISWDILDKKYLKRCSGKALVYQSIVKQYLDNNYTYRCKLTSDIKERLLDEDYIEMNIPDESGHCFMTTMSSKLIPAIKQKGVEIEFLGKVFSNDKDSIYEMLIVTSSGDGWKFFSRHYVLNIE